ncbi:PAS domain S-box-containing protein/diguanylate cyclase (GGDEF) domain-containing protein [Sphingopyxis sp. YR583]|uniref:bifunctional diguanylate cyclase/phosphodiesterase n=1 Tax=Sphingopyxis sp. YR583 TaxID=1881047 RepID=UPI0008A74FA3|nr:EAL domain-containing protein [Sphingopyxis sp. YR583]SEH12550.1 PAS domain S-box-containing protein/diguanylate cyclase (GGDEF) domain-containing protein [Sphingopyxis sp. YR583]
MFRVIECIVGEHDLRLVLLAALVWLLGSAALFFLLKRSIDCVEERRRQWLAVAALAAGVGVWATHFIAMLAYDGSMPLRFDPAMTTLSVGLAVLGFWLSFLVAGRGFGMTASLAAGMVAALGVAAMHFTGMAAIEAPASVRYDVPAIASAIAVNAVCFFLAFAAFGRLTGASRIALPTLLAVLGVVALHFTSMSATMLVPDPARGLAEAGSGHGWLVTAIVVAALSLIGFVLAGAFLDRMLTDLRGFAEATLEGIAILSGGRIVEANAQLAKLLGVSADDLVGTDPTIWLAPGDGRPLAEAREEPAEALVTGLDGETRIVEVAAHAVEYRGRQCQVLAVRDLTARKRAELQVEHLATHDALTGLPNRTRFTAMLDTLMRSGEAFALLALDLDRFKAVNDLFGHTAGDAILCRVAALLRDAVAERDLVARIGGDEFLILQRGIAGEEDAQQLVRRILADFARELDITRDPMAVGVSIGVALYPADADDPAALRHNADVALYRAKERGRGMACFFDLEMDRVVRERRELEHDLRHAIARRQLSLMFQPLVATAGGRIVGYEALLRWAHPTRGSVPPETFVPIAEDVGAIIPIGEWVLREACAAAMQWPEDISIAVNVSAVQFQLPNLAAIVEDALDCSGLDPSRLELEVTESVMLRDRAGALATLHRLKALGVRIVMDDFGTGYSSLSNLQAFPFDKIKIDRSFVSHVTDDQSARSIIRAIVALGKSLDLPVVAEGVETEEQRRMVLEEGCPQAQGFLFGSPAEAVVGVPGLLRVVGR